MLIKLLAKNIDINNPLQRISWLMMKLDSDYKHKTDYFGNKFIPEIEKAMRGLPEPVMPCNACNDTIRTS